MPSREEIVKGAKLIQGAKCIVALTGAGISAPSGLAPFRGEGAHQGGKEDEWIYPTDRAFSFAAFELDPKLFWKTNATSGWADESVQPNAAHYALAKLEQTGKLKAVITQNFDRLHQKAGSQHVIELHQGGQHCVCLSCGSREPRGTVLERLRREMPPRCQVCGSAQLKPDILFYGEEVPPGIWAEAATAVKQCDLLLAIGTSLVVYPAARLIEMTDSPVLTVTLQLTREGKEGDLHLDVGAEIMLPGLLAAAQVS